MSAPFHRGVICGAWLLVCACSPADPDARQRSFASADRPTSRPEGREIPVDGAGAQPASAGAAEAMVADSGPRDGGKAARNEVVKSGARLIRGGELSALWVRGGTRDDSLVALPISLAADAERVVVFDGMDGSFTAYSATTGEVQWQVGRRGMGPDEYSSFVSLARTPAGDFLALDWQTLRLTYLDPTTGRTRRAMRWPVASAPQFACVTADDRLLTLSSRSGGKPPLIWIAGDTAAVLEASLPWPDAREAYHLAAASILAAGPDGDCVLALRYGRGFARYRQQDSVPHYVRDYVEPVPLATLTSEKGSGGTYISYAKGTVRGAIAVAVSEEQILVAFGGRSELRRRLVDRYHLADGSYAGSFVLPFKPDGIAVSAGRVFVIDQEGDYPAVRAFALP